MKRKLLVLSILLMTMMAFLPMTAVQAFPSDEWDETVVIIGMKLRHRELRDLDTEDWVIDVGDSYRDGWLRCKNVTVTDISNQYDLEWTGRIIWSIFTQEWTFDYEDYYDFNVTCYGAGTTNPAPGMHYIKPGTDYEFAAVPDDSGSKDWKFVLDYWEVTDGTTTTQVKSRILEGTADSNLNITAVFRRSSTHTCMTWYEDGLTSWNLWQYRHVPITVWLPFGPKYVTITIDSDYGLYDRTFYVSSKDMCVFFNAERFVGDYTVTVTAVDAITDEGYSPKYFVAIT